MLFTVPMNTRLLAQLEELNLSSNEARVYLALLEIGQTSAGEVIKKTQLHRSVVYETLDKLIDRKLVFKLERQNIAHFQAHGPERIIEDIQSQEALAMSLLPDLQALATTKSPEITVYEGVESYRRFWIDSIRRLPKGSTGYVVGSNSHLWTELMGPAATKRYFKVAAEQEFNWKMIVFEESDIEQAQLERYTDRYIECRLLNKAVAKNGNYNVLDNECLVLHSSVEPLIIEVKNPTLVAVFRNIFDVLWDSSKPMKSPGSVKSES